MTIQKRFLSAATPWLLAVVVVGISLILFAPSAQAQEGPTPTLDQIQSVARELYCPLCNGVRLDNCELQACVQMRQVIAERLAAGVPKDQIKKEFVAQYGPVVLGEPPREGLNWLVWILPIAALLAGAAWVVITMRKWTRASAAVPTPATPAARPATPTAAEDDYLARVDADLDRLD